MDKYEIAKRILELLDTDSKHLVENIQNLAYEVAHDADEECEFAIERLKVLAELKHFAELYNDTIDWDDVHSKKHCLYYNSYNHEIEFDCDYFYNYGSVYFSSLELAQQAVKLIGEDRIKKYYFEVKE